MHGGGVKGIGAMGSGAASIGERIGGNGFGLSADATEAACPLFLSSGGGGVRLGAAKAPLFLSSGGGLGFGLGAGAA